MSILLLHHRLESYEQARATAVRQPSAPPLGLGAPDDRVLGFADILALPDPEWSRPQHAEVQRQAYADAEARIRDAMYPQKLPVGTKRTTSATVRAAAQVAELLELLAEGLDILAGLPRGRAAARALAALAGAGVSL